MARPDHRADLRLQLEGPGRAMVPQHHEVPVEHHQRDDEFDVLVKRYLFPKNVLKNCFGKTRDRQETFKTLKTKRFSKTRF